MHSEDHFWQKFSEILLTILAVFFAFAAYRAEYANHIDFANAMLDNEKLVLGALLGLLTKGIMQRVSDSNGNNGNGNGKLAVDVAVPNKTTEDK